jgi:hypothetical protein
MTHGEDKEVTFRSGRTKVDAALIQPFERDKKLDLHSNKWGAQLDPCWRSQDRKERRHFRRVVRIRGRERKKELEEYMVRFPSAPIYGINRKQDYETNFKGERPNMHTLRLLCRPGRDNEPVEKVFLLHNGLNETQNLRFFYRLADWILEKDEKSDTQRRSACLIAPFPGHLMHFAHVGKFAQSPLARYLSDSGDLFRQFMRYMVEMHWLLSVFNEKQPPRWMVGGDPIGGRLALNMGREWEQLRQASFAALEDEDREKSTEESAETTEQRLVGKPLGVKEIEGSIEVLRSVLGMDVEEHASSVPVHVVGYSLGGFLAQSVFFAWPNMVTSCATICSGGAISALSPTAFAHSEEWQAVLHSLRAEIEGSMLAGKIAHDGPGGRVAGMAPGQFGYFHRIFNQVFLQEDQASYKQRLSEYGSRMLFVSGGEDPIVKTEKVLDASPPEGITMLSIARMTHFLGEEAKTDKEVEQRRFWLPEAGGLIARAAGRAEVLKREDRLHSEKVRRKPKGSPAQRPKGRELASEEFESALDWVVTQVKSDTSWLFVCRNGLPGAFLPPEHHQSIGTALHHHDVAVQDYVAEIGLRGQALKRVRRRTTLVVSHKVEETFIGEGELFEPHSDAPGKLSTRKERAKAWKEFIDYWESHIRWFKADPLAKGWKANTLQGLFAQRVANWQEVPREQMDVASIPDVWISLKDVGITLDPGDPNGAAENFVRWVSELMAEQQSEEARARRQPNSQRLVKYLADGRVRIVKVSGADLNPRYRGRFESELGPALLQLAHCAAALVRSTNIRPSNKQKG